MIKISFDENVNSNIDYRKFKRGLYILLNVVVWYFIECDVDIYGYDCFYNFSGYCLNDFLGNK